MIDNFEEIEQIIRPIYDSKLSLWTITLDYHTKIPLFLIGSGSMCHLPWNGSIVQAQILHREPVKSREELLLEWLRSPIYYDPYRKLYKS